MAAAEEVWGPAGAQLEQWYDDLVEYDIRVAADFFAEVLRTATGALMAAGDEEAAWALLDRLDTYGDFDDLDDLDDDQRDLYGAFVYTCRLTGHHRLGVSMDEYWVRAAAEAVAAAYTQDAAKARKLLTVAEDVAVRLRPVPALRALTELVRACAAADPQRAARLHDRIERWAATHPDEPGVALHAALAPGTDRSEAAGLVRQTVQEAEAALLNVKDTLSADHLVIAAVQALTHAGDADAAEDLLLRTERVLTLADRTYSLLSVTDQGWFTLAQARAREGRTTKAWEAVVRVWEGWHGNQYPYPYIPRNAFATPIVDACEPLGDVEDLLTAIRTSADDHPWLAAEGLAALAGRLAPHDPEQAEALTAEAEQMAADTTPTVRPREHQTGPPQDQILGELAVALTAIGDCGDAERLLGVLDNRLIGTLAASRLGAVIARESPGRASDLLAAATRGHSDPAEFNRFFYVVAESLATIGDSRDAVALVERHPPDQNAWLGTLLMDGQAMSKVVGALCASAPTEAIRLADTFEDQLLASGSRGMPLLALCLAGFLTAAGHHDADRVARLTNLVDPQAADRPAPVTSASTLLMGLLRYGSEPALAPRRLQEAGALGNRVADEPPVFDTEGAFALVYAALGRYEAVSRIAHACTDPSDRVEVLALVAAYLAGSPDMPLATRTRGRAPAVLPVVHKLIALSPPTDSRAARAEAARLVTEILDTRSWYTALPAMAALAPQAVRHLRDVVFANLDVQGRLRQQ